ncbi:MAG: hypothetical protein C0465_17865 [Ralstonia sp.]|uniref:hypothetical protein n=1 Tax=Ralstonia sp. TaxID=54061 RepID=UPI00257E72E9|nr:hypothetical protein [Ralstonia sp.]MBA4232468.1 hypothetical protein [Ralstonia sp.]
MVSSTRPWDDIPVDVAAIVEAVSSRPATAARPRDRFIEELSTQTVDVALALPDEATEEPGIFLHHVVKAWLARSEKSVSKLQALAGMEADKSFVHRVAGRQGWTRDAATKLLDVVFSNWPADHDGSNPIVERVASSIEVKLSAPDIAKIVANTLFGPRFGQQGRATIAEDARGKRNSPAEVLYAFESGGINAAAAFRRWRWEHRFVGAEGVIIVPTFIHDKDDSESRDVFRADPAGQTLGAARSLIHAISNLNVVGDQGKTSIVWLIEGGFQHGDRQHALALNVRSFVARVMYLLKVWSKSKGKLVPDGYGPYNFRNEIVFGSLPDWEDLEARLIACVIDHRDAKPFQLGDRQGSNSKDGDATSFLELKGSGYLISYTAGDENLQKWLYAYPDDQKHRELRGFHINPSSIATTMPEFSDLFSHRAIEIAENAIDAREKWATSIDYMTPIVYAGAVAQGQAGSGPSRFNDKPDRSMTLYAADAFIQDHLRTVVVTPGFTERKRESDGRR